MIIHCMKKTLWLKRQYIASWGHEELTYGPYIHCSSIEFFHRVAPNFSPDKAYVLLIIDEEKITSEIKYEDDQQSGRHYPHIYGLVNNDAVVMVLPFLRDNDGNYMKNKEFSHINNL